MEQGTGTKEWFLPPAALMCPEEGHHSTDDRVTLSAGKIGTKVGESLPCVTEVDGYIAASNTAPHLDGHRKAEATVADLDHSCRSPSQVPLRCTHSHLFPVASPQESLTSQTLVWALSVPRVDQGVAETSHRYLLARHEVMQPVMIQEHSECHCQMSLGEPHESPSPLSFIPSTSSHGRSPVALAGAGR